MNPVGALLQLNFLSKRCWNQPCFFTFVFLQFSIHPLILWLSNAVNFSYWTDCWRCYFPKNIKYYDFLVNSKCMVLFNFSFFCNLLSFFQVLIFSQFTRVVDLLEYYLGEKGMEVCRIDGRVKLDERKRQVSCFQYSVSFMCKVVCDLWQYASFPIFIDGLKLFVIRGMVEAKFMVNLGCLLYENRRI